MEKTNGTHTIETKKSNVFSRIGGWVKGLFTKKSRTRGQLRAKSRTVVEKTKIVYYKTRNRLRDASKYLAARATDVKNAVIKGHNYLVTSAFWLKLKPVMSSLGMMLAQAAALLGIVMTCVVGALLVSEATIALAALMGEALAVTVMFVVVYLMTYYTSAWLAAYREEEELAAGSDEHQVIDAGTHAALVA